MARFQVGDDGAVVAGFRHTPGLDQGKAETLLERRMVAGVDPGPEGELHLTRKIVAPGPRLRLHAQQHGGHHTQVVNNACP